MIPEDKVRSIGDTQSLLSFMSKELDWELPSPAAIDELTFEWTGTELSLSDDIACKFKGGAIKQIQPLRKGQPWGIFLVDFAGSRVYTTALRQVLRRLVPSRRAQKPDMPAWYCQNMLFICTTENRQFTFAHFCGEKPERARLTTFSWTPQEPVRTLCEYNLPALQYDSTWNNETWLKEWQRAFDVEKVTREFFSQYALTFTYVEKRIKGFRDQERRRLFTQHLFNRLMFIRFIQKKGWLKLDSQTNYLTTLWRLYAQDASPNTNFYRDRLKLLFFAGLSTPNDVNVIGINQGGFLKQLIGDVPYLNGGLFEELDDDRNSEIIVPDECIEAILIELFDRFNFTVTESTPLDVEVAVDPEMLGKVFEELVTGRHETGSYYTPKPIVSFMCREGLNGYLRAKLPNELPGAIQRFVEEHDSTQLRNPESVLEALHRIKVCDPACGSGAYLLGMLHELIDLRACLFATRNLDPVSTYQRKLEIIQNNLYGVDLDEFAVNIARLRLWLSLAVEFEGSHPPPLPNLDFKIETGDSLLAPDPSVQMQGTFRQKQIDEYLKLKASFMTSHGNEKLRIRQEIEALRNEIAKWTHGGKPILGFDWQVEFAEVFANKGFDIVLANPPYVRQEQIFEKQSLMEAFGKDTLFDVFNGRADLYVYFYARALQILNDRGILAFISSDKFISRGYAEKLRGLLTSSIQISSLIDFGEYPIFGATIETCIFIGQKSHTVDNQNEFIFCEISLAEDLIDMQESVRRKGWLVTQHRLGIKEWVLAKAPGFAIIDTLKLNGISLGEYVNNRIFSGIKTGRNDVFIIDENLFQKFMDDDPVNGQILKRWLVGNDIENWGINWKEKYLIFTKHGVDISKYPSILKYLKEHKQNLLERATVGQHEWYELQQPQMGIYEYFSLPKIVYQNVSRYYKFAYDDQGFYPDMNIFIIPTTDLYIMGIICSSTVQYFAHSITGTKPGGFLVLKTMYVSQFPIPSCNSSERQHIVSLVSRLIARNQSLQAKNLIKKELDDVVYQLFRLSSNQVSTIKEFIYQSDGS